MKKIDCVLEYKKEQIKELIMGECCPFMFNLNNGNYNCEDEKSCKECWSEEMEEE